MTINLFFSCNFSKRKCWNLLKIWWMKEYQNRGLMLT